MIRITAKLKIAAGLAAGALTLGAAGAYAAANANNTITVDNPTSFTLGTGDNQLTLVPLNGAAALTLPANGFKNTGECVSWLAKNRNYAVAPQGSLGSSLKLSKNYHGKLMSGANAWCKAQPTSTTKTDSAKTETPDATESDSASTDSQSGASHGHGHAYGHSKHVAD